MPIILLPEKVGRPPSLTAALVVLMGVQGAVIVAAVLAVARVRDDRAQGLGLGMNSCGNGPARAFQIIDLAGAFSALAMGLMELFSGFVLLYVLRRVFCG